jgi:hypothetical protein
VQNLRNKILSIIAFIAILIAVPASSNMQGTYQPLFESGAAIINTLNPADRAVNIGLFDFNLGAIGNTSALGGIRSINSHSSGKYYFEVFYQLTVSGAFNSAGIATLTAGLSPAGIEVNTAIATKTGGIWVNAVNLVDIAILEDQIGCFAIDLDNGRLWIRTNNGLWNNDASADPATNVGGLDISPFFTTGVTQIYAIVFIDFINNAFVVNFGATPFTFGVPANFTPGFP